MPGQRCLKCKEASAVVRTSQIEPLCLECLLSSLLGKFKAPVNQNKLVRNGDRVLVAFSGGHASRACLAFLQSIQAPEGDISSQGLAARGRIPFRLAAAFIDERVATGIPDKEADKVVAEVSAICATAGVALRVERLENVFELSPDRTQGLPPDSASPSEDHSVPRLPSEEGEAKDLAEERAPVSVALDELVERGNSQSMDAVRGSNNFRNTGGAEVSGEAHFAPHDAAGHASAAEQLRHLLSLVYDQTAIEDLVTSLRMELLEMIALREGFTRLSLGTTTSRVAAQVLASISKGRGFSLPGEIQYLDCRWPVPLIRPMRDCVLEELALYCHLARLQTAFAPNMHTVAALQRKARATASHTSINQLAASFAAALQRDNHSRQSTIARTALKLQPFPFNEVQQPAEEAVLRSQADKIAATYRAVMSYEVEPTRISPESLRQRQELQDRRAQQKPSEGEAQTAGSSEGSTGIWLKGSQAEEDVAHACSQEGCGCENAAAGEPRNVTENGVTLDDSLMSLGLEEGQTERLCAVCREPFLVPSPSSLGEVAEAPDGTPSQQVGNGEAAASSAQPGSVDPASWSRCFCCSCQDSFFRQPGEDLSNEKASVFLKALPAVMRSRAFGWGHYCSPLLPQA